MCRHFQFQCRLKLDKTFWHKGELVYICFHHHKQKFRTQKLKPKQKKTELSLKNGEKKAQGISKYEQLFIADVVGIVFGGAVVVVLCGATVVVYGLVGVSRLVLTFVGTR